MPLYNSYPLNKTYQAMRKNLIPLLFGAAFAVVGAFQSMTAMADNKKPDGCTSDDIESLFHGAPEVSTL